MTDITRRRFLQQGGFSLAGALVVEAISDRCQADEQREARFTMDLRCGSIGVQADQSEAIRLAGRYGFESVTPEPGYLADLSSDSLHRLQEELKSLKLVWGAAGLPVEFRRDEQTFSDGLAQLTRLAAGLQRAGVTRVGTWLSPAHDDLTYLANFRQHVRRLRACAEILRDHGLRLGLEYVGPRTLWASRRHSFIHTMAETKDLISEIDRDNVGFVLDSWHWYTAHETVEDLRTLTNLDVVACDLNDAPAGIEIDEQIDSRRELPMATGVIDLKAFLGALVSLGYDGPIRAEPFNRVLNEMEDEAAVAETARAMRQALGLARPGNS